MSTIEYPAVLDDESIDWAVDEQPDLVERLHAMRAEKPYAWIRLFGQPAVIFLTFELVDAAFRDEETFPSQAFYDSTVTEIMGRTIQCMYGPEHRTNRALVSPAFRSRLMPGYVKPLLEPAAHALVDRFVDRGEADLVAEFTKRYPFEVICALLGVPNDSMDDIQRWAIGLINIQWDWEEAKRSSREFTDFLRPLVNERRDDPRDDLLSTLATTEVEDEDGNPARLTDEEIFSFARLLFPAGADTTYLGLGNTLLALLGNPDQLEIVKSDPAEHCRWAAEEGVRLNPPVALQPRMNPRDVVWHDIAIPGGTPLVFCTLAANRDPAVFDDPDRFDVTRRSPQTTTFGFGAHFCLGAHLARAEMDVALQVLVERLPEMRMPDTTGVEIRGTVGTLLRGPTKLPVVF